MKSRWEENPSDYFFELFVLDIIGQLPADRTDEMNAYFKTSGTAWHEHVKKAIHLSQTIEVAILDLWYRNQTIAREKGEAYSPEDYAADFVANYFADDSKVDVWEGNALDAARQRIAAQRSKH